MPLSSNDEEDEKAKEYFRKIQGEREADKKPERTSSIAPDEFLRREKAHKDKLKQEEEEMKKTLRIMQKSFLFIVLGILGLGIAFMGIFWIWPLFCTMTFSPLAHILFFSLFLFFGIAGIILTIAGITKLLGSKKIVMESRDPEKGAEALIH
jgi:hypothetical protein